MLSFHLSGKHSILEISKDGVVTCYGTGTSSSSIPTQHFRNVYYCEIPSGESQSEFTPPVHLLTTGGQSFEFYGVDLINQIWFLAVEFNPCQVHQSLFSAHPTWQITSFSSFGPFLFVGTKEGIAYQVSAHEQRSVCRLQNREISFIQKTNHRLILVDSANTFWIKEDQQSGEGSSLQCYENQNGIRSVLNDRVIGLSNGMICVYPSLETISIASNLIDFLFVSNSLLLCLSESGSVTQIEVNASIWNSTTQRANESSSAFRELKRSTSVISHIHSRNIAQFNQLEWEKETTKVFSQVSIPREAVRVHLSDSMILCELSQALPSCVTSLLVIVEDLQGEVNASIHSVLYHEGFSHTICVAHTDESVVSSIWTLSFALIARKEKKQIVSKTMSVGWFSLVDLGIARIRGEKSVLTLPPQPVHLIGSWEQKDLKEQITNLGIDGVELEIVHREKNDFVFLKGSDVEAIQRVRVVLCRKMLDKLKEGNGWPLNLPKDLETLDELISTVESVNPGRSREERLKAIKTLWEINEKLSKMILSTVCEQTPHETRSFFSLKASICLWYCPLLSPVFLYPSLLSVCPNLLLSWSWSTRNSSRFARRKLLNHLFDGGGDRQLRRFPVFFL